VQGIRAFFAFTDERRISTEMGIEWWQQSDNVPFEQSRNVLATFEASMHPTFPQTDMTATTLQVGCHVRSVAIMRS
jgi:UDP-N-acetylglucosamine enolpyruvyl transferase